MNLNKLKHHFPNPGKVEWIGTRSGRDENVIVKKRVLAIADHGLEGDRSANSLGGKRQVTFFQAEYLSVLNLLHTDSAITYEALRRNIVISGINLNALINQTVDIGQARIQVTGLCHPCSKMEKIFGKGAYNALRGHGGLTAKIVSGGEIAVGDSVIVCLDN